MTKDSGIMRAAQSNERKDNGSPKLAILVGIVYLFKLYIFLSSFEPAVLRSGTTLCTCYFGTAKACCKAVTEEAMTMKAH